MDGKIYNRILLWAYTRYTFPSLQELANIMAVERITPPEVIINIYF
mgnify:CR=1 FL=1